MYVRDAQDALHDERSLMADRGGRQQERSQDGGATSGSEASRTYIGLIRASLELSRAELAASFEPG